MAKARKPQGGISKDALDALLGDTDLSSLADMESIVGELKKALVERMLNAEMDLHLQEDGEQAGGNHRNGHSAKTVLTGTEQIVLDIPRDPQGHFEPQLIGKYQRRFPGFDDKIIALYASGMSTRDIQRHVEEIYGVGISPELVSAVTDSVLDEAAAWQSRPLDATFAIVYFDALRVKIRDEGIVKNKAIYLAIGIGCDGMKHILGLWIEQTEGAKFWMRVMSDLQSRGVKDILMAVVDGLKGFPDAITAVFPQTVVQTCIVHLVRYSMQFTSWSDRRQVAKALRPIYSAANVEAAEAALTGFEESEWGRKYPSIAPSWRRRWDEIIPFFVFSPEVRKIVYTTNAIESLHSQVRKAIRNKGHFPSDTSATKLIYLALMLIEAKWKQPPMQWHAAKIQLHIQFGDRFGIET